MKNTLFVLLSAFFSLTATANVPLKAPKWKLLTMYYNRPATYFEESLPIGNGRQGALIYGDPADDIIHLNDITLWTGQPVDQREGEGASAWIPRIREALFREDYRAADSLQLHVQGHNSQFYQPLATMHLRDLTEGTMENYRRGLSLDSALVQIAYRKGGVNVRREYFASHPEQMIAIRLVADRARSLSQELTITSQVPHTAKASLPRPRVFANGSTLGWEGEITMTGHAIGDPMESIHFCSHVLVRTPDGQVTASDSTLCITNASEIIIYFVDRTSFNGARQHPVSNGAPYLETVADDAWRLVDKNYNSLRERHVKDYERFFDRVELRLGKQEKHYAGGNRFAVDAGYEDGIMPVDELLREYTDHGGQSRYLEELYFQYGRYLLISCSRTPGVPANLQGLWTPHKFSPWRGNYTMNINLEENYWPAFVANLKEMAEPLDAFVASLAENGRHTAHHFYGIENGWCASHNSDIWAMTNPVGEQNEKPEWANWNMGGAWLVHTLWERYLFTGDKTYLQNVAFPLMKGAAEFCLDWLIENPKHRGELITAPSTSPENEYVTDKGYHGMTCYGGTADLAIIRELLTNLCAACRILDTEPELQARAADALRRLHPYTIGSEGDLNEWFHDWKDYDPHHRHQSHLIGLYPGNHMLREGSSTEIGGNKAALMDACRQTLVQKGDETTGWSTGWRINLWARLHDGEQAYHILQKLLTYVSPDGYDGPDKRRSGGTYPNLMDAHPPFQIDGNFGGTAGMCEMLMQSQTDGQTCTIELLPALPQAWNEGSVGWLCARGGFETNFSWKDGLVTRLAILSRDGGTVLLRCNGTEQTLKLKPHEVRQISIKTRKTTKKESK